MSDSDLELYTLKIKGRRKPWTVRKQTLDEILRGKWPYVDHTVIESRPATAEEKEAFKAEEEKERAKAMRSLLRTR